MKVEVVCFGVMRDFLPEGAEGNRASVELDEGASVRDVVRHLGAPERLVYAVLVDGTQAKLDENLTDGSELTLMPPFTGGG